METHHPLFQQHPLDGEATLSTGVVPTPYHIYDGYGAFIGGTADLNAVQSLLQPEQLHPLRNRAGQALMGVWVCNFESASLGPHHELQFSIFVTRSPQPPIDDGAFALLAAMLTRPEVEMLCHGLWNNSQTVVAYNRELLGLNARLTRSDIRRDGADLHFRFAEAASDTPILSGTLGRVAKPSLAGNLALMQALGLRRTLEVVRRPAIEMTVVNPVGVTFDQNLRARTYTKTAANQSRAFDPARDSLQFGPGVVQTLGFAPAFAQFMTGFRFVYCNPT